MELREQVMRAEEEIHDGRLDHFLQLGMLVVFWHIIAATAIAGGSRYIQGQLFEEVTTTLREEGFRKVKVEVEGRAVTLSGEVPGLVEQQRAIALAAMVRGTHLVSADGLRFAAAPSAPAEVGRTSEERRMAIDEIHRWLQDSVRFANPTSSRLTTESAASLASVAALLEGHPGIRGEIEVRTTPETAQSSPGLAERRANVVRSVLLGLGIERARVSARGEDGSASPQLPHSVGFLPAPAEEAP